MYAIIIGCTRQGHDWFNLTQNCVNTEPVLYCCYVMIMLLLLLFLNTASYKHDIGVEGVPST
jgi:hypothetical protein